MNLNIGETDCIRTFEKAIIKKFLKFASFDHSDHPLDALKINSMEEKIKVIKMSFIGRLLNNNCTREFTKEIIKLYNLSAEYWSCKIEPTICLQPVAACHV